MTSRKYIFTLPVLALMIVVASIGSDVFAVRDNEDTANRSQEKDSQSTQKERSETTKNKDAQKSKEKEKNIKKCDSINTIAQKITNQLSEKKAKYDSRMSGDVEKTQQQYQERVNSLAEKRQQWDEQRQRNFTLLREKAISDQQKTSVEKYIDTVSRAILDRRTANDQAIEVFYNSVLALRGQANAAADTISSEAIANVNKAATDAIAECNEGADITVVKASLKAQLKQIREDTKSTNQASELKAQLERLVKQRKDTIATNVSVFKESVQGARKALLAEFGSESAIVES